MALPSPGTCSTIIVSVLTLPPSLPVDSAFSSALLAPARLSLPISRMFWSLPSTSVAPEASGGTAAPCGTLLVKFWNVAQASPLPMRMTNDSAAATMRSPNAQPARHIGTARRLRGDVPDLSCHDIRG